VNPANGDYFSVTVGDFTVEAASRTTFPAGNFDERQHGQHQRGHANVLRDKKAHSARQGQSSPCTPGFRGRSDRARRRFGRF